VMGSQWRPGSIRHVAGDGRTGLDPGRPGRMREDRLVVHACQDQAEAWPDGVVWVGLRHEADGRHVVFRMAEALDAACPSDRAGPPTAHRGQRLRACHLGGAVAPRVAVLATSRAAVVRPARGRARCHQSQGVHPALGMPSGHLMGDEAQRPASRAGWTVRSLPRNRRVIGGPAGDDRTEAASGLLEVPATASVPAHRPLIQALAAVPSAAPGKGSPP
jgi:hypothetical protein